jgi:diguanylate cyclase (GGDEF)-like protein
MAYSAAAMYGGAAALGLIEGLIPGGEEISLLPAAIAFAFVVLLLRVGPRFPLPLFEALGPIGAILIAGAISSNQGPGDGAVLYMWPVLWQSYFFGRRGSIMIVAWIGVVHGFALETMQPHEGAIDRWLDVMISVGIVAAVVQAMSERNRRLLSRLTEEARVDKLTEVFNRRGFDERVEVELAQARREGTAVAAVAFDIDHFKRINDEWGHEVGDQVLVRLGAVLRSETRDADVVARVGGEEFVTLLARSDVEHAKAYAERVRAAFSANSDLGLDLPQLTVSAGVAAAVAPDGADELLHVADAALYAAKRGGRDRAVVHGWLPTAASEDDGIGAGVRSERGGAGAEAVGTSS